MLMNVFTRFTKEIQIEFVFVVYHRMKKYAHVGKMRINGRN